MAFSTPKTGSPKKEFEVRNTGRALTEARREKLLSIKKREDMKEVLVSKLAERVNRDLCKTKDARKLESNIGAVKEEVDSFLGHASITENNLKKLERKVQKRTGDNEDAGSVVSHYSVASSMKSHGSQAEKRTGLDEKKKGFVADWRILDEYAMMLHQQDANSQKGRKKAIQQKLYNELTEQVNANKGKGDYIKVEDAKYHEESLKELELWRIAEEEKMQDVKYKNMIEKQMRDEQLVLNKKIIADEEAVKAEEEKKMVERIRAEIVLEEEKRVRKIENQKAHMAEVFKENQENRAQKEKELAAQVEEDIRQMREYNKVLDEQDKARHAEKAARLERQKVLLERMKKTVLAQAEAKGAEDELRAAKQKEEADMRALEAALMKQQKLEQLRGDTRDYLLQQIQQKTSKKQQALELKRMQAHILGADTVQYDESEKKKAATKKLKAYQHQKELLKQIQDKEKKSGTVEMSAAEEAINRDLLQHVHKALAEKKAAEAAAAAK